MISAVSAFLFNSLLSSSVIKHVHTYTCIHFRSHCALKAMVARAGLWKTKRIFLPCYVKHRCMHCPARVILIPFYISWLSDGFRSPCHYSVQETLRNGKSALINAHIGRTDFRQGSISVWTITASNDQLLHVALVLNFSFLSLFLSSVLSAWLSSLISSYGLESHRAWWEHPWTIY